METLTKIGNMDAILFALILEVALIQTRILEGSTEFRAEQWKNMVKHEKLLREKLVRDRETVQDIVRRTLIEIAESGQWFTLQNAVEILKHEADLAVCTRLQYEELRRSKKAILVELDGKRRQWAIELRSADLKTALLRDRINDDQVNANARLAYAEKWMLARAEALDLQYDQPRAPLPRIDHEQRVHQELLRAYAIQIQEREEAVKYWEQRYGVDIKDISERLVVVREQLQLASGRHAELQKKFDLHEGEIRGWLTFKRERAARIAREEHLRASATRIQAWWRGQMVRRALGQFKFLRNIKKPANKGKKK